MHHVETMVPKPPEIRNLYAPLLLALMSLAAQKPGLLVAMKKALIMALIFHHYGEKLIPENVCRVPRVFHQNSLLRADDQK